MRLYGKNPVLERIKSNPKSICKIYISEGHEESGYIRQKAKKWGIPFFVVPATKIQKMGRNLNTQGILAEVEGFPYHPYEALLEMAREKNVVPVFLDEVNDPQNLGGILRSLACLGQFSVVLPTHHSVDVTESVLRVASGGENFVPVAKVSNLSQALSKAREQGIWMAGTVVTEGEDIRRARLSFPMGLVVGSEQKGIREVIRRQLDVRLTLPMAQARLSMNVAHATAIFCYEIARQRMIGQKGS